MASVDLEYNQGFKIYKGNAWFNNLVLHKATYETVVMSLGDKISGIVYYKNNKLVVDMTEYIMYKDVKYVLVNPPTIIKEGLVSDNGELKGMTKYSFTFYHPMYMLSNFPFSDVAVDNSQKKYLSQNKTFSWIGNLTDYVAKLNKNLEGTQWKVLIGTNVTNAEKNKLSEVLSFDNNTIADALKTAYETWEIPYIVDKVEEGTQDYLNGKRFIVQFGLPSNEIYEVDEEGEYILDFNNEKIPFVFKYGQGVGLKNNSRTPKNNKIVTRIAGYGSEDNIPYGYPQIVWTGNQSWNYTINNDSTAANSYPIYDGIVGGQKVRLIKHPFTRTHLMPPIYSETVNKKVNPNATGYDPNTELVDYYDANDNTYPNQIKAEEPSYEIHEFEDIKPEFGSFSINSATPYDGHSDESITQNKFLSIVDDLYTETDIKAEKTQLNALRTSFVTQQQNSATGTSGNYEYDWSFKTDGQYKKVKYASSGANFEYVVNVGLTPATIDWDDTMDEQGNYVQSYFKVSIPALGFDLYASAAITQEMTINMRSGACIGCSFPVMVDWDDYKRNFYDKDGNFAPNGTQRNLTKYPNSTNSSITLILQKETSTFGTLMPNIYQQPKGESSEGAGDGDNFVILGISLPTSYITTAEGKLETEMKKYMRDNNVYYYEYPLKFDEHFLISNEHILSQMKPNVIVKFEYADVEQSLYIKQMSIKYNESPLPKYDITLTDDVDVVLNKIGEAIAEYRGQRQYENGGGNSETLDGNKFLRKDINDTASGTIRMLKGLQVGERFVTGLLGEGGIFRKDNDGTTYLECDRMYVRMKAYFDTVEVRRFLHSGGNRIASAAGIKCSRVEYIASNGLATQNVNNAVKFRCYFRAQDNGVSITNDFEIGDQAYCKETNANLGQHSYWRLVIGTSSNPINGEHYIDLSNYMQNGQPASMQWVDSKGVTHIHPSHLAGSDAPIAQDDIIQLGHAYDKERQGAIVEYVSGEDAPSYQIYQGINTYNLNNKNYIGLGYSSDKGRAYMNVYGDFYFGSKNESTYIKYNSGAYNPSTNPDGGKLKIKAIIEASSTIGGTETATTIGDILSDINDLQRQIDGAIETWFYDYMPVEKTQSGAPANRIPLTTITIDGQTVPCEPYYSWYTADHAGTAQEARTERTKHLGDMFYDNSTGYAFRFSLNENTNDFEWVEITDSAVIEALRKAAEAFNLADTKNKVFTTAVNTLPPVPYKTGDLWVNATGTFTYTEDGQQKSVTYNNDILRCVQSRDENASGSRSITDWVLASKYTDDTIVEHYMDILTGIVEGDDRIPKEAALATEYAIRSALGGNTIIDGGLMLTSILALRKLNHPKDDPDDPDNYTTYAGISGVYDPNLYGGGIAAWYGGGMVDKRNPTTGEYDVANGAKSGFRFDGSGWLANGNINWNAQGAMVIKNIETIYGTGSDSITINELSALTSIFNTETYGSGGVTELLVKPQNAFSQLFINRSGNPLPSSSYPQDHTINDYSVLNYGEMKARFVPLDFFNALFAAFSTASPTSSTTPIDPKTWAASTVINNLKIKVGTWTEQYLSALGLNSQSGGGGGIGDVTWELLASNSDKNQIAASHLNVLNGYATQSWVTSQISGNVSRVDVGTTQYSPSGGVVTLPAYPTTLPIVSSFNFLVNRLQYLQVYNNEGASVEVNDAPTSLYWHIIRTVRNDAHKYYTDIAIPFTDYTKGIHYKVINNGTLANNGWVRLLDTINYTDYTVSKTGGGASGTWGISISGTAADSDKLGGYGISRMVFDIGGNFGSNDKIYDIGSKKVFSGNNMPDAPVTGWVSGIVLGSNWNDSHYQNYLVESGNGRWYTTRHYTNGSMDEWKTFAYLTDNVASATKLQTSRTIWGQSFDGTANVTGAMSSVTNIDGVLYFSFIGTSYKIGIGTNEPDAKLHVSGNVKANNYIAGTASGSYIQIGAIRIEYEQSTQSLKVYHTTSGTNANLYATGAVSALGSNSQSGGGGVGDVTWELLASSATNNRTIHSSYIQDAVASLGYAKQSWVTSQGYLTSSALSSYVTLATPQDINATKTFTVQQAFTVASGSPFTVESSTVVTNLNADKLDGQDGSYYATATGLSTLQGFFTGGVAKSAAQLSDTSEYTAWGQTFFNGGLPTSISNAPLSGVTNIDSLLYFNTTNTQTKFASNNTLIQFTRGNWTFTPKLYVDGYAGFNGEIYANGLDLVGSNASGNVHGGYIDFHYNASTADFTTRIIESANGVLSIMKSSGATGLVVGNNAANGGVNGDYIKIGGATLTWDGSALKIDTGFYSESFVSALGTGSGGGGGVGDVTWALLADSTDTRQIAKSHLTSVLAGYLEINNGDISVYSLDAINALVEEGAKIGYICVECNQNGRYSSGAYIHEINDFSAALNLNYQSSYGITMCYGNGNGGNVSIGYSAPNSSYKLCVNGNTYLNGVLNVKDFFIQNSGPNYYNIGANGVTVYQNGTWTGGSDIRRKDIVTNIGCDINQIASAPIFDFIWKADITRTVHVGTSAQYWSKVFENAVSEGGDGYLYMDYGATALASAVITARKVLDHEGRIRLLEIENQALRKEIEQLKKAA